VGTSGRSPVQTFSLAFGLLYLLIGLAGFTVTGFDDFMAEPVGGTLIIFGLNPLHNIVHILIGAAWAVSSRTHIGAKNVSLAIGAAYALVAILGFFGALKFLSIDSLADPDNFLHIVTAALAFYFATAGSESSRAVTP
jgi:Domain of unknown function (DUF4383)